MIEGEFIQHLLDDAQVSRAVGGRVYSRVAPPGTALPRIVIQRISGAPEYVMAGESGRSTARLQVTTWARSALDAAALFELVRQRISGHAGPMGNVHVQSAFFEDYGDEFEESPDQSQHRLFGQRGDLLITVGGGASMVATSAALISIGAPSGTGLPGE